MKKKIKTLNFSILLARSGMGWLDHTVAYLEGGGGVRATKKPPWVHHWLLPLWDLPPVCLRFLSLGPSRSRSPIPSLALSWWSPCPILRRASMSISCCVLRMPSAFLWLGLVCRSRSPCRPSHAVSSIVVSILCAWSLLRLGRLPMRWVTSEPMGFEVALPMSPYNSPG